MLDGHRPPLPGRCRDRGARRHPGSRRPRPVPPGLIRTELGRFGRQVSGYSLEHLLPEKGTDLAKALVGTEGTLGTLLGATVRLVPIAAAPVLVVLGYPDMPTAADAVPALLAHAPLAIEGMDSRLVDVVRRVRRAAAVPTLPPGGGWLMVEVGGATSTRHWDARMRSPRTPARPPSRCSRPVPTPRACGASARTAPASPAARRRGAGLARLRGLRRCRRRGSVPTCASSRR